MSEVIIHSGILYSSESICTVMCTLWFDIIFSGWSFEGGSRKCYKFHGTIRCKD
jgi:hypothetical protein